HGQRPAQPGHVAVEGGTGIAGGSAAPDPLDELADRDRLAGVHGEGGEHAPLPGMPQRDRPPIDPDLHLPKQPQLHYPPPTSRRPGLSDQHARFQADSRLLTGRRDTLSALRRPERPISTARARTRLRWIRGDGDVAATATAASAVAFSMV